MYRVANEMMLRSGPVRRTLNHAFYQVLSWLDRRGDVILMNYGYQNLEPEAPAISMSREDESNRYSLQLYHHAASGVDIRGKDVLEVGSGRGGGASYVRRTFAPRSMTGADYSSSAVAFCQRHHRIDGLRFVHGDAEALPFDDNQFDAVINVESSHCYGSMTRFLSEVKRVLRPGGNLLWVDHRPPQHIPALYAAIEQTCFTIESERVITQNVLAAMRYQGKTNRAMIDRQVPAFARHIFYSFAGVEGTQIYNSLAAGELRYLSLVMKA